MRGVRGPDEHRVRGVLRPARQIGCTKIRRVELRSRDLGNAVDATAAVGARVPALPSRQRLPRGKACFLGGRQARYAQRDAARGSRRNELASRKLHVVTRQAPADSFEYRTKSV